MPKSAAAQKSVAPKKKPEPKVTQPLKEPAAEWVQLDQLVPWGQNPKPHEDVRHIVDSIKKFGFGDPLVARRANNEVLAGHGRLKAARIVGLKEVPVRFLDLSERDAHLYALAVNRLAEPEKSPWNPALLYDVLSSYSLPEAQLAGWDSDDLSKLAGLMDDAAGSSAGDDDGPGDQSDKAKTDYAVLIECEDEQEQLHVIAQCESLGLKPKALV